MKRETIIVPENKCPLDVLAEMGEITRNAWIYLHENAVEKLLSETPNSFNDQECSLYFTFGWNATEKFPDTSISISQQTFGEWRLIYKIKADDISFKALVKNPEDIFFLQMKN